MALGIATSIIIILLFSPPIIALILCLTLIKKKPYKKLGQKQIYAGFWQRFIAGFIDLIILIVLIVLFIELSGYGILASLSRLLNAL